MTAGELIESLRALIANDPAVSELPIVADGCDCWGDAMRVRVTGDEKRLIVLVERTDNVPMAEGGRR